MELSPQQDVYYIDIVSPIDYFIDTVTPSAIQLNKEKTMSIELDGPLYLGSNSLQQQVDQNTADITDLKQDISDIESDIGSLDNLATSDKSSLVNAINETLSVLDPTQTADYIKNSKGLESGEISTNASILPWVEEMSHSTFDRSKFTVNGNPIITDDGIAITGRSTSNVIRINSLNIPTNSEVEISFRYDYLVEAGGYNTLLNAFSTTDGVDIFTLSLDWTNNRFTFKNNIDDIPAENVAIQVGKSYDVKITTDMTSYLKLYLNGELKITLSITNAFPAIERINIGNANTPQSWFGENNPIDLKQFSITVDGVEVFSGNKTGIDVIKPDNYTVVGTPNISADGVASGFSNSNYLTKSNLDFANANSWKIVTPIHYVTNSTANGAYQIYNGGYLNDLYINASGYIKFNVKAGTSGATSLSFSSQNNVTGYNSVALEDGKDYVHIMEFTGTQYIFNLYKGEALIYSDIKNSTDKLYPSTSNGLNIGNSAYDGSMATGSIDLNGFKIYVDSSLVYQPCLKIPYTESKTGSKIVDSIYRDRVNDMAEQFGYANYYTLNENVGNFTLPQVELYGLIGQRTLRDSYRNGINYWELYSNRDLEQGGSCTSGVEVTFARPFADTNYVLSVPYSAKSTTAFTPTQTGDWIAKGKGIL